MMFQLLFHIILKIIKTHNFLCWKRLIIKTIKMRKAMDIYNYTYKIKSHNIEHFVNRQLNMKCQF